MTRYSLRHLLEPAKAVKEMKRICGENGKVLIIDVTADPDKVDAYNRVEKMRDPSHAGALTKMQLENIIRNAGLAIHKTARHDLEVELKSILHASILNPGDVERVRQMFEEDVTQNNLGMRSHLKGGKIHFYFPITMIHCKK